VKNEDNSKLKICDKCDKVSEKLTRCKIFNNDGKYEPILNICDECMKKYNYKEYDGSDWVSDWN